jgi:hypothetical protein
MDPTYRIPIADIENSYSRHRESSKKRMEDGGLRMEKGRNGTTTC